ncbi:hypothetical protein J3Q64DRAFT_1881293 [Phycomyces blakesleeanus]|uniref:Phospholipid/glycerol acyltransferase domain-containing protein n=1 Tax=Phycomyces blakesleeanus TaxID=4837 RepID=A0ABR3AGT8_PHYBL
MDPRKLTYDLTMWLFNLIIKLFFREVRPRGAHRIPKQGPVIFVVAPHANQFVDPILVMRECGRRVSFLIAEKSMHQRGIGFFARMINAIPVVRSQDLAVLGKGRIQLLNCKTEPFRITGIDTQFLSQLKPRDSIVLPKNVGQAEVVEILSDTELVIKKDFKDLKSLELLTSNDGTPYKCMPHIEQDAVYKSVHDELNNNGCITIFPEGGSHDRAEMLPLKAGVTLMALGAMAKYPGLDVKIVPCGLNYFHAHRFRSRAVVEFGNPITIPANLVDKFIAGGVEKREACGKLLDTIYNALKSVTVNAGTYETLMLIQAARRLYKPAHRKLHISHVVDLNRRFLIGYNLFKDDPKVIDLQQRVLAYNQLLKYHGIQDHQVSKTDLGGRHTLAMLIERLFFLSLLGLWGFPGAVLNLPIMVVAKVISEKKASAALRGSTVKIAGRDVLATWKVLVALVLVPTLYAFYSFIVFMTFYNSDLAPKWKFMIPGTVWVLLCFTSYASLRFGEIGLDILKSLKPLVMSLLDPDGAEILRQSRSKLSRDITDLINEYGPKAFPDFDAEYISRTAPMLSSSSRTGSSTSSFNLSTVQSKLPKIRSGFFLQATRMDWLDDKHIFNWGSPKEPSEMDDLSFLHSGHITGCSGSASESHTPNINGMSRSNSFCGGSFEMLRMEALSTTTTTTNTAETSATVTPPSLTKRPTFKIENVDENISAEGKVYEDEGYAGDQEEETGLQMKKRS